MITKIKVFILNARANCYATLSRYYFDKAIDLVKAGRLDSAERCQKQASKYMMKHCDVFVDLVRVAC